MDSAPPPDPPPPYVAPAPALSLPQARDVSPGSARRQPKQGPLELGVGTFLLSGGPAGAYGGLTAFLKSDWGQGVFVRPALILGQSTGSNIHSSLAGGRIDTCGRIDGNYRAGQGIQLDVCGGIDAGWASVEAGSLGGEPTKGLGLPYLDLGPSVDLRGELGSFAVTLRTVLGFAVARGNYVDATGALIETPAWPLRVELGFSWDVHHAASPPAPEYSAEEVARRGER